MRKLFFGILILGFGMPSAEAANRYIRQGATGNGSGSDWIHAFPSMPSSLDRGDVYYIADGSYGSYTFDDTGAAVITLKKATANDHGTGTGWDNTYGDDQAVFGGLTFVTDNWVIDGSVRNENQWNDGSRYGIKTTNVFTNYFAYGHASDNVTLKYLDIGNNACSGPGGAACGELIYLGGFAEVAENWLVQRCYIHNGDVIAQHAGVHNVIYEYNFIGPNWSKSGIRQQVRGSSVVMRFNIFKNACQGNPNDPTVGNSCTAIVGWYGNAGSNGEDYSNSAVYGNLFWDTNGTVFYSGGALEMGDDRTSQGGGPQNCTGCKAFNNTFVGIGRLESTSHVGLKFGGTITNSEARNNIWHNIGNHTPFCQAASCSDNPTITNAGIFTDAGNGNFRLASDGVAGTGVSLAAPYNVDMDGKTRGASGVWDVGAYEFGGTPPPTFVYHPADTDTNKMIALNEATSFGACWKSNCNANATLDNAVRAGTLWNASADGEYNYNAGLTCPQCWEIVP